ncbi:MAG: hypothetical protein IJS32_04310 [Kiritimatiellae bacterium]|nr:hypothetical protein [Kiritimatiellia bacterium]
MAEHCPKDGGWIGDAGCTHPNHEHSEFVKGLLAGKPREITPKECDALLREGVYVESSEHRRVGFGKSLLKHIESHGRRDAEERKRNILYAIATVKSTKPVKHDEEGFAGRVKWVNKNYKDKIILVVSTPETRAKKDAALDIDYVFTIRKERKP